MADGVRVEGIAGWARWKEACEACTVGIEEEVMLLEAEDLSFAQRSDELIGLLSPMVSEHATRETHAGVLELRTGAHSGVAGAVAELWALRRQLGLEVEPQGVKTACAGMHPLGTARETRISGAARYQMIAEEMRCLALREPTMALHVHVAVADPDDATRVLRRMRECVPLLVALSANSPFSEGRDTGFASTRTVTFDGFPRTGLPRAFGSYGEYVDAIDALICSQLVPDSTYLWWDTRLKPALGTVEVRVMDAQSTVTDVAALVALVQSLARVELTGNAAGSPLSDEVLAENRFLAARDGLNARLVDPATRRPAPVRRLLRTLVDECRPHAEALGCAAELEHVKRLIAVNGAIRQRAWVSGGEDLREVLSRLAGQFIAPLPGSVAGRCEVPVPSGSSQTGDVAVVGSA
jgi:glutamate---cysteine ligase / carboxylate-amine ligase